VTILTARQVAGIVAAQGPPSGTTVAEWVQVAKDESSYDTTALSPTGCCRGLWQINVRAHRDKIVETRVSIENGHQAMKGANRNFYVARQVYTEAGSWRPWSAVRGAKPVVSAEARAAAANPDYSIATQGGAVRDPATGEVGPEAGVEAIDVLDVVTSPIDAVMSGLRALVDVVNRVGSWVSDPHNWTRVGYVGAGVALVIAAGAAVASDTKAGQVATSVATKGKL
jgi:hypothetical protein